MQRLFIISFVVFAILCCFAPARADFFEGLGYQSREREKERRNRWDYMEKSDYSKMKADYDMGGKEPWDRHQGTWYLAGNFGYATYYFSGVNSYINDRNDELAGESIDSLQPINGGIQTGLSVSYWATHRVLLGAAFHYLAAATKRGNDRLGDEINLSAFEWSLLLKFGRPVSPNLVFFMGFEPTLIQFSDAFVHKNRNDLGIASTETALSGSRLGIKITLGADYKIKQDFALGVEAGYRTAPHLDFDVDYTGFFTQAGVRLYLR